MNDSDYLRNAAERINEAAGILKADNDAALCDHWKQGQPITGTGFCWSCNRKEWRRQVDELVKEIRDRK